MEIDVENGLVREARYDGEGCLSTLGCAEEVVRRIRGLSFLDAAAISEADLLAALPAAAGRPDSAALALDALHAALSQVIGSGLALTPPSAGPDAGGVLVGMSGGVDSAVAALLLQEQGYRVVGATLRLWDDATASGERSCCSPETVRRARRVAHGLGLPHLTVSAEDVFGDRVVRYFVEAYASGLTPNPCAKCNAQVRFEAMLSVAARAGLAWVATGHYARMVGEPRRLARGVDVRKDQSYVLAEVHPRLLEQVLFPLGEKQKPDVRALAAQAGLEGAQAAESQEICFVPDDDHRRFLAERLGERPGLIVDSEGRTKGSHRGTYHFTVGQRKGLGIAAPEPLYVIGVCAERDEVVVGTAADLQVCSVRVDRLTWHRDLGIGATAKPSGLSAQLRSSGATYPVEAVEETGGEMEVVLATPACGVAAGQTAVLYRDDAVVVAGTITATTPCRRTTRFHAGMDKAL